MGKIAFNNVNKVYPGGVHAVKHFNLVIEDEAFVVFVGPSGCGKSTVLRMVAGLEDITDGEIQIDDRIVNDMKPKDRDISLVFQNYALFPHMSVYQNIALGLQLRKVDKRVIEEKVKKVMQSMSILDLIDRKPKALSGGQQQRVALARAIVRDPNVFLMDEPLSNLDAKLRVQMRTEISELYNRLKTTFIYVTHDQVEAMTMGTRIVVMDQGVIQQVDTPMEIYENPSNLFVASFIGTPQMNLMDIQLLEDYRLEVCTSVYDLHEAFKIGAQSKGIQPNFYMLGIRPEDICLEPGSYSMPIKGTISLVENLGSETLLYVKVGHIRVVVKVPHIYKGSRDTEIILYFDTTKIFLFDKTSQNQILNMNRLLQM